MTFIAIHCSHARPRPPSHPLRRDPPRRGCAPHRLGEDRVGEVAGGHRLSPRQLLLLLPADDVDPALDRHLAPALALPALASRHGRLRWLAKPPARVAPVVAFLPRGLLATASSRGPTPSRSGRGPSGRHPHRTAVRRDADDL